MQFKKGQRVRHPTKSEWGLGEVLEDTRGDSTRVFFVGDGEKTIRHDYAILLLVQGAEGAHPVLDNLHLTRDPGIRYRSLPESIQFFLGRYPEGFYDKKFLEEERDYKVTAHALFDGFLDEATLRKLCEKRAYAEVGQRAMKVVNMTNLIFPNEKMALSDALKSPEGQEQFAPSLFECLYGAGAEGGRFDQFARMLGRLGAGKWTTATYFLYLARPERFMFVKPTVTQNAAAVSGFEISYKPEPNWPTYSRVLGFSEYLKKELSDLKPRDMIDVQSFMWCIAPET